MLVALKMEKTEVEKTQLPPGSWRSQGKRVSPELAEGQETSMFVYFKKVR